MRFAKILFLFAGITGLVLLVPQYFLEAKIAVDFPPAITHPEYFYGFIGVSSAFQIVFLMISTDPLRYRPLMLASVVEKFSFAFAVFALYAQGRVPGLLVGFAGMDLTLGALFAYSFFSTRNSEPAGGWS
jgi:hypothetical protein